MKVKKPRFLDLSFWKSEYTWIGIISLVVSIVVFFCCKYFCMGTLISIVYALLSPFALWIILFFIIIEQEFILDLFVRIYNFFQRKRGGEIKSKPQNTFLDCFNENGEVYFSNLFGVILLCLIAFFPELRNGYIILALIFLIIVVILIIEVIMVSLKENEYEMKKTFWYYFIKYGKICIAILSSVIAIMSAIIIGYRSIAECIFNIAIVMLVVNITFYIVNTVIKSIKKSS